MTVREWLRRMFRRTPALPSEESEVAYKQAERLVLDAERRDVAAADVADRLRKTRARNNFGAAVERSMRRP